MSHFDRVTHSSPSGNPAGIGVKTRPFIHTLLLQHRPLGLPLLERLHRRLMIKGVLRVAMVVGLEVGQQRLLQMRG